MKTLISKALCLTALTQLLFVGQAKAEFTPQAEYLLVWVLANDYIDSGLRYQTAPDCYTAAQNIGLEMGEVNMKAPQFICMPLADDYPLAITTKQAQSRFPF